MSMILPRSSPALFKTLSPIMERAVRIRYRLISATPLVIPTGSIIIFILSHNHCSYVKYYVIKVHTTFAKQLHIA